MLFLIAYHIILLHNFCSINNVSYCIDYCFGFYGTLWNDFMYINLFIALTVCTSFFNPILLGDYANVIYVNYLSSPVSINPEWYFCSVYAMLSLCYVKVVGMLVVLVYFVFMLL